MRGDKVVLLMCAAMTVACTRGPEVQGNFDEATLVQEVTETLADLTEAMNSHDPDRIFAFYRQDERFFYLGCTDVLFGWSTFASRVEPYYTSNPDVTFDQEVLSVQILSSTVAVAALRGNSTEASALFWTEVLQKDESGRWLVTYEHESWPGCSVPRGPHMGTEGVEGVAPPPDTGVVAAG
jgi:ketosteroid isomerase-like protein